MRRHTKAVAAVVLALCGRLPAADDSPVTLTLEQSQAAGIAGFRALWNTPIPLSEDGAVEATDSAVKDKWHTAVWSPEKRRGQPGALAFDALHRSALVRFPDAAEKIAAQVRKGYAVEKVELVLPFKDTELWPVGDRDFAPPDGYLFRNNFDVEAHWKHTPPQWHAVAWALRRPWQSGADHGPTYNAYIHGAGHWSRFGAQGDEDRHAARFGPAEVSYKKPDGRLDVTATLTDSEFGKTLAERLRALADCGFLLKKWETYDHRYFRQVYEFATGTGGRAIRIRAPRLVVTLKPTDKPEPLDDLARPADVAAIARELRRTGAGGKPTAVLPTRAQLERWTAQAMVRPQWMSPEQYERVRQLFPLAAGDKKSKPFYYQFVPDFVLKNRIGTTVRDPRTGRMTRGFTDEDVYNAWVDSLLGRQPRGWYGFEAAREMTQWFVFRHTMPEPAREQTRLVWEAWLMPDRPTKDLVHPMVDQLAGKPINSKDWVDSYYAETGDWRGNKSFYRDGFCYVISTQNFNAMAASGALLAGSFVPAPFAVEDGRNGVEKLMLRQWAWKEGVAQENIDHYYFPTTLTCQKTVADFGPTPYDRLTGASMLTKSMDEILSTYHPALRRFTAPSSRTSLEYLFLTQEGLQYILHTVLPEGALRDLGVRPVGGMPLFGHDVLPERIAQQTLAGPWAPDWMANKTLPFEETSRRNGAWQCGYQGASYGLASWSHDSQRIQVLGQWRRTAEGEPRYTDIVTLNCRYGLNRTRFANEGSGWVAPMGQQGVLQHKNKLVVVGSPGATDFLRKAVAKDGLQSLQSSIALYNFEQRPGWEVYVDGAKVTRLPHKARAGQRITVKDGVSYLGVIALPATDLGRTDEVVLRDGDEQTYNNMKTRATLVIDSYNLQRGAGGAAPTAAEVNATAKSCAGFAIEMGDEGEHGSFAAFQRHFAAAKLGAEWDAAKSRMRFTYTSGGDTLSGTFDAAAWPRKLTDCTVNGKDPYLPEGVFRDTSVARQGRTGELTKAGMTLRTDPGVMTFVRADPASGTYMALNPLPDPTTFTLSVPGGVTLRADGKLGLAKVIVRPKENKLWIDHAAKEGQKDLARTLTVAGLGGEPVVILNGKPLADKPEVKMEDGKPVYLIPLP